MSKTARRSNSYQAGVELAAVGRYGDAIAAFEAALRERPNDVHTLFALGNAAEAIGHSAGAETFFRRVLAEAPDRLEALVNLANLLRANGRAAECIGLLKPAIERNPRQAELWLTLGSALRETGDAKTAELFYREALRLDLGCTAALGNLADLMADAGAPAEALALYERALQTAPGNAQAHLNRAILLLLQGEMEQGWRDYEYRLAIKKRAIVSDHGLQRWSGAMECTRLLVTAEQGLGDQIMFASLIPELTQRLSAAGGRVLLEAEPRLVPLFARSFPGVSVGASHIETRAGQTLAHYSWLKPAGGAAAAIPIGSLPSMLRTRIEDFRSPHVYLKADAQERGRWQTWLASKTQAPAVGFCWRSGKLGGLRNIQYAPLETWAEFLRDVPATPVSLQYDATPEEIEKLQRLSGRTLLVPPALDQKNEIDRTAALVASLDAVMSAPTSVAWIAAAIGTPTMKLLYNTTWTGFGRDVEAFAPCCRLIMPDRCGNWPDTFATAGRALKELLPP